jgi:hypothetical protein
MIIKKVAIRIAHGAERIAYKNYSLCAMLFALCILFVTLFAAGCAQTKMGCAQAKDYVGVHHGSLTVGMKQRFGQGGNKKNYYVVDKDSVVAVGDNKEAIARNLGYPDKVERSIDGYEVWVYKERKVKLFLDKEYLKEWRNL